MIAPSGEQITISLGDQQAVIVEVGGGIRSYSVGGCELVDGYAAHEMSSSGRGQVLIPWPNRLEDGSYEFDGKQHQLPLNEPERRNAIHGLVRWATWSIAEREAHRVVMQHVLYPQPGYPFLLRTSVEYALSDLGLRVRTTTINLGSERCPFERGAHPYLTLETATIDRLFLTLPAGTVLQTDQRGLPIEWKAVDGAGYDFRQSRPIGSRALDHAFTGLQRNESGIASVKLRDSDTGLQVSLWVDRCYPYLMIFGGDSLANVSRRRRSLAVEPMTCPPNAFRTGVSLIRLESGSSCTGTWGIACERNSTGSRADFP
jgi:aldose 1-epimerase